MAHRFASILMATCLTATSALAQQPGPQAQPTPEQMKQMQAMMQQQMQMMAVMFDVRPSKLGYDETVNAVKSGATQHGWSVGAPQDMQAKMREAGMKDAKRMTIIPACPGQANERLAKASGGKVPPLPCRVTVFEGKDGKTMLMRMNMANIAKVVQDPAVRRRQGPGGDRLGRSLGLQGHPAITRNIGTLDQTPAMPAFLFAFNRIGWDLLSLGGIARTSALAHPQGSAHDNLQALIVQGRIGLPDRLDGPVLQRHAARLAKRRYTGPDVIKNYPEIQPLTPIHS